MASVLEIVVRATNQAGQVLGDVQRQTQGLSRTVDSAQRAMRTAGTVMSATMTPAAMLMGDAASDAAVNLEESINAVNVVFGEAADTVLAFGEDAVHAVGLSQRAFNEAAVPIGAALRNVGLGADEAADASISLAQRAADMASVFNVDVGEALSAIQAGLRGEADPLERFGAGFTAAEVAAKAVAMGLAATTSEVDANARAQASLALIMDRTQNVAGDFERTIGSAANQERVNAAAGEELAATYGEKLIPAKQALNNAISTLIGFFASLSPQMQTAIVVVAGLAAAIGPLLLAGAGLISAGKGVIGIVKGVGSAMTFLAANPIVLVVAAIAGLVAGLIWLWNNSQTFRDIVTGVFRTVGNVVSGVADAIGGAFESMAAIIRGVWDGVTSSIKGAVNFVIGIINRVIGFLNGVRISVPAIDLPIIGRVGGFSIGLPHIPTIPYLRTGAWEVLADTLAFIHRGEMVVPAGPAGSIRDSLRGGRGAASRMLVVNIHNFVGSDRELDRLADRLGRRLRLQGV